MEKFSEHLEIARKKYQISDHMINVTYPMLRDTRLLVSSVENIFLIYTNAMAALLHFERLYKRIPPFNDTFESKFFLYTNTCQEKFNLDREYAHIMREIKQVIIEHKKSPVEFSRNDKYVICSSTYNTLILTHQQIKSYLNKAKLFIDEIKSIIDSNKEY